MKSVFLSVVVICALTVAGIGGTLAGFSDTEMSAENFFEVGNLDLTVSVGSQGEFDDKPYGTGVPAIVKVYDALPCTSMDSLFDIHNNSDSGTYYAYICFKNYDCYEVITTKHDDGRPEPEKVAEYGGWLANQWTPGQGAWGQNCTLDEFLEINVQMFHPGDTYDLIGSGNWVTDFNDLVFMHDLWPSEVEHECKWIYVGEIPACNVWDGKINLHISNWSEEMWSTRYATINVFTNNELPFNDWLTNLFMNDGMHFDVDFALTQEPIPAANCFPGTGTPKIGNPLPSGS